MYNTYSGVRYIFYPALKFGLLQKQQSKQAVSQEAKLELLHQSKLVLEILIKSEHFSMHASLGPHYFFFLGFSNIFILGTKSLTLGSHIPINKRDYQ